MATVTTVYTYALNGSARDFSIPFEYLARRFVTLTLIGTDRKELVLTTDYRFTSKTSVQTTKAWGPGDGYTSIEVRRNTSPTDRLVDYADGSILRAYELNISQIQTMHIAEEARNMVADTIGVNNEGHLDARGRRIVNVATATLDGDAVSLGQVKQWSDSALNQADRAQTEANKAATSATTATTKANEASTSASNALSYRNTAESHKNAAATSATTATTKATEATTKATEAATSATTAESHKNAAATSATTAESHKNAAATSAAQAQGWAAGVNMPSALGNAGKMLAQNNAGTGLEYLTNPLNQGFGGATAVRITDGSDLNNLATNCWRFMLNSGLNTPGSGWYVYEQIAHNTLWIMQIAYGFAGNEGKMFFRWKRNGTWDSTWTAIHTQTTAPLQSSSYDATVGRLLKTGAFGLGSDNLPDIGDLNTFNLKNGWYRYNQGQGSTNGPETYGIVLVSSTGTGTNTSNWITQTFHSTTGVIYVRHSTNLAAWSAWKVLATSHNIAEILQGSASTCRSALGVMRCVVLPDTPMAANAEFSIEHSLGGTPIVLNVSYRCKVSEWNHPVGTLLNAAEIKYDSNTATPTLRGPQFHTHTATTLAGRYGGSGPVVINRTTAVAQSITLANWDMVVTVGSFS